jgi:hypothetical protein
MPIHHIAQKSGTKQVSKIAGWNLTALSSRVFSYWRTDLTASGLLLAGRRWAPRRGNAQLITGWEISLSPCLPPCSLRSEFAFLHFNIHKHLSDAVILKLRSKSTSIY